MAAAEERIAVTQSYRYNLLIESMRPRMASAENGAK
jgi:hypothetical protein